MRSGFLVSSDMPALAIVKSSRAFRSKQKTKTHPSQVFLARQHRNETSVLCFKKNFPHALFMGVNYIDSLMTQLTQPSRLRGAQLVSQSLFLESPFVRLIEEACANKERLAPKDLLIQTSVSDFCSALTQRRKLSGLRGFQSPRNHSFGEG